MWLSVFFFQAEDGIRDLVRSRGLGDVYKRQDQDDQDDRQKDLEHVVVQMARRAEAEGQASYGVIRGAGRHGARAVSYTHLTLPTSDLV